MISKVYAANRAEDDLRTLVSEREIRKDPKRFKAAQQLARKKLAGLKKVASGKREAEREADE